MPYPAYLLAFQRPHGCVLLDCRQKRRGVARRWLTSRPRLSSDTLFLSFLPGHCSATAARPQHLGQGIDAEAVEGHQESHHGPPPHRLQESRCVARRTTAGKERIQKGEEKTTGRAGSPCPRAPHRSSSSHLVLVQETGAAAEVRCGRGARPAHLLYGRRSGARRRRRGLGRRERRHLAVRHVRRRRLRQADGRLGAGLGRALSGAWRSEAGRSRARPDVKRLEFINDMTWVWIPMAK